MVMRAMVSPARRENRMTRRSTKVSIAEAKAQFAALVTAAQDGASIVVTRNNQPVARLVAFETPKTPIKFGTAKEALSAPVLAALEAPLPDDMIDAFYRSSE